MANEIIVAVFESSDQAEKATQALERAGVPHSDIERLNQTRGGAAAEQPQRESRPQGTGFFFWDVMFGLPSGQQDRSDYERRVERGETVLAVTVAEEEAEKVMSVLERHAPLDLEERPADVGSADAR